jgi:hypothetical protein
MTSRRSSFAAGTPESRLTPRQVATYNGLTALARTANHFRVEPLGWNVCGIASAARTSSWARYENDAPVMVTLRPHGFGGARGCDRFHEDLRTDTTITVASMTDQGITESSRLGLVAAGNGQVTIGHSGSARVASVTAYGLGGVTGPSEEFPVVSEAVAIPVRDEFPDGTPIERYEINLS